MGWEEGNNILFYSFILLFVYSSIVMWDVLEGGEGEQRHISFFLVFVM